MMPNVDGVNILGRNRFYPSGSEKSPRRRVQCRLEMAICSWLACNRRPLACVSPRALFRSGEPPRVNVPAVRLGSRPHGFPFALFRKSADRSKGVFTGFRVHYATEIAQCNVDTVNMLEFAVAILRGNRRGSLVAYSHEQDFGHVAAGSQGDLEGAKTGRTSPQGGRPRRACSAVVGASRRIQSGKACRDIRRADAQAIGLRPYFPRVFGSGVPSEPGGVQRCISVADRGTGTFPDNGAGNVTPNSVIEVAAVAPSPVREFVCQGSFGWFHVCSPDGNRDSIVERRAQVALAVVYKANSVVAVVSGWTDPNDTRSIGWGNTKPIHDGVDSIGSAGYLHGNGRVKRRQLAAVAATHERHQNDNHFHSDKAIHLRSESQWL